MPNILILSEKIPAVARWLDKLAEEYIKKKLEKFSGDDKDKQIDALKNLLINELQEKHHWRMKADILESQWKEESRRLITGAVKYVFDNIQKDYILLPRIQPPSLLLSSLEEKLASRKTGKEEKGKSLLDI